MEELLTAAPLREVGAETCKQTIREPKGFSPPRVGDKRPGLNGRRLVADDKRSPGAPAAGRNAATRSRTSAT
jgi:hypothetical protein